MQRFAAVFLFLLVVLNFPTALLAQTAGACEVSGYVRWDGEFAHCVKIDIYYAPDPSGVDEYFRFTGIFNLSDEVQDQGGRLDGPVRWYVDGVPIGDSEVSPTGPLGNELFTVLLLENLRDVATTVSEGAQIHAEYLGSERYSGDNIPDGPDPDDPEFSIRYVAFKGERSFTENGGQYQPLKTYPVWDATISAISDTTVDFAETMEVRTSWVAPNFDQNVLAGRTFLYRNSHLFGATENRNDAENYHSTFKTRTLGIGEHTFDSLYVGFEGAIDVVGSITMTVEVPPRPLHLRVIPEFAVARAGAIDPVAICAFTAAGYPAAVGSREIEIELQTNETDPAISLLSEFDETGCAPVSIDALGPGQYSISGQTAADDTFLSATSDGSITIVPADETTGIALDLPAVVGQADSMLTLYAPHTHTASVLQAEGDAEQASGFETISGGTVLQAEIVAVQQEAANPTGGIQVFLNGQHVASGILSGTDASLVDIGPFDLSEGDYALTVVYTGDENFALNISDPVSFSVDARRRAAFSDQAGLSQEFDGVTDDLFDLAVSLNVENIVDSKPIKLTGSLITAPGVARVAGVPAGTIVFFHGDTELGRTRVSGFSGTILLPGGLLPGNGVLSVEYQE